jgi:hypothetical protein
MGESSEGFPLVCSDDGGAEDKVGENGDCPS